MTEVSNSKAVVDLGVDLRVGQESTTTAIFGSPTLDVDNDQLLVGGLKCEMTECQQQVSPPPVCSGNAQVV